MYKRIAVEDGLTNVIQELHSAGFHTVPLEKNDLRNISGIVVKGDEPDILSQEGQFRVPVVHAVGRSAEEIVEILRERLS